MEEPTCFMPPFSYASGVGLPPDQRNHFEGNPMSALTQSISFGRFVSESASWDRWSVITNKHYVEEAKKFSKPGSVAQKKAFFEAHYKEMAMRKAASAAALLEQANAPVSTDHGQSDYGVEEESWRKNGSNEDNLNNENKDVAVVVSRDYECGKPLQLTPEVDVSRSCAEIWKRESEKLWRSENSHIGSEVRRDDMVIEEKIFMENNVGDDQANREAGDTELSRSPEMEKLLLKDFVCKEIPEDKDQKKPAVACSKVQSQKASSGVTPSPAMATMTPLPYWKGNNITQISRNFAVDRSDIKRPTPKRLPLGNLTPVREISKATGSWRMGKQKTFGGATKDCPTPSKTPTVVGSSLKYTLATPKRESERTPVGEGPKRRSLAKECSMYLSACKNKLQSPSLSTPFRLRMEERAVRRKAKLEEKFDADDREKIQLQNLLKEREEMEMKKFRQTLCFKARPLPKFYRESTPAKSPLKKVESNLFEFLCGNRKPCGSTTTSGRGVGVFPQHQGKKPILDIPLHNSNLARENRSPNIR